MEEYIRVLSEQIRYKKARTAVEEEIRQHIEDQAEAYEAEGIDKQEAVVKAVRDMGDPVEAGVALDRIHRPRMAWDMILLAAVIGCLSIFLQIVIGRGNEEFGAYHIMRHIQHVIVGFVIMLAVYRLDYSVIGKYAKYIAAVFLIFLFLNIFFIGYSMNGVRAWAVIPFIGSVSMPVLIHLYIPLYAGILYSYRGSRYDGIVKSILWMLAPAYLMFMIPRITVALFVFFIMALLLSLAVWKDWFRIPKAPFLLTFWSCLLLLPVAGISAMMYFGRLESYKTARLKALLSPQTKDFMTMRVREYIENSRLWGNSGNLFEGYVSDYESDYVMTFVASYYGIAVAVLLFAVVLYIAARMFRISLRQKNQLGMMMGCGCGLVFLLQTVIHMSVNFGLTVRSSWSFMPFFSYGGTSVVVSYILLGIVLSIYRYKEILSARTEAGKLPKILITIEK